MTNPLKKLRELGQSPWLDSIRRSLMSSGELAALIERDGLTGVTSNPSIFDKAIRGSREYDDWLEELQSKELPPAEVYERIAFRDIQAAADVLRVVYDATKGEDGFVSLEVSPHVAGDTERTLEQARRLWRALDRPNVMIKVPATEAGIPAIEQLVAQAVNVNVTLLFSRRVYERVVEAYLRGLERRAKDGGQLSSVASVASFFVSRIDAAVERRLEKTSEELAPSLVGEVAVANAKLAYRIFERAFAGERWEKLAGNGARKQRLLWASTSTKNPSFSDTMYVDALIGPDTVNTMPMATLDAYRDHGNPAPRLRDGIEEAEEVLARLERAGVSLEEITDELTREGVRAFAESFDSLLRAVDGRCRGEALDADASHYRLPAAVEAKTEKVIEDWSVTGKMRRLWERDSSVWTGGDEGRWLGWLDLTDGAEERAGALRDLAAWVREAGFRHAVVLGMGGSSLCPDVLAKTFGRVEGHPELAILDSTDPAQVRALEERIELRQTLFIVSSKSGTTLEPNIFASYFLDRMTSAVGEREAGSHFLAVTDPGSKLEELARARGFAGVYHGVPSVGGRYSALSAFGMVPAAVMGLDVADFLSRADVMAVATSSCVPVADNPGARLGAVLGVAAREGRDKLTFVTSPGLSELGAWLEQLIAESTGKQGRGILPVDREELGAPDAYGDDRLFAYVRLEGAADAGQDDAVERLEAAGHPVVRIPVSDVRNLGQEFFRWEMATAVAGAVIGIHPFDQPDVEASKVATRKLTEEYERSGRLPSETPLFQEDGIELYADDGNRAALGNAESLPEYLRAHLDRLGPGDYFAVLAYVEMSRRNERPLQSLRHRVRDRRRVATCLGFGPRFLHSTGQAYKGGPPSGVFLQVTCDAAADVPVPGHAYTFGVVETAQARGDFEVLAERGRRALRVHIQTDVTEGLERLAQAVEDALP